MHTLLLVSCQHTFTLLAIWSLDFNDRGNGNENTAIAISFCCLCWYDLNSPRKLCANAYKQPKTIWIPTVDGLNTHTNLHALCKDGNISLLSFLSYSIRSCRVCRLEWVIKLHGRRLVLVLVLMCTLIWKMWCGYYCYIICASALYLMVMMVRQKKCLNTLNMQAARCLLAQMSTLLSHSKEKDKNDANERVFQNGGSHICTFVPTGAVFSMWFNTKSNLVQ